MVRKVLIVIIDVIVGLSSMKRHVHSAIFEQMEIFSPVCGVGAQGSSSAQSRLYPLRGD